MTYRILIAAVLAAAPVAAASAMPVSTFLEKAASLKRKGPLAVFSGDLKLLMNQIKRDGTELRAENQAAAATGRRKAYCTPAGGVEIGPSEVIDAMNAVPSAQRARTTTKDAMRAYFARRFPCKA
jgi:hypothetical protein